MKTIIKYITKIVLFLFLWLPNFSYAISISTANNIFNEGEKRYPELFSPIGSETKIYNEWFYRYYEDTNIFIGINTNNEVYLLADGYFSYIGTVHDVSSLLGISDGSDGCVTVELPPSQLFVTYRLIDLIHPTAPIIVQDTTFLTTTDTFSKVHTTQKIDNGSQEFDIVTSSFVNNDMLYVESVDITITGQLSEPIAQHTTYTPAKLAHPFRDFCEGSTWTSDSVTETTAGITTESTATPVINGTVESVNETVELDIGTFNTVRYLTQSEDGNGGYSITWISIDFGIEVRVETYNASGILTNVFEAIDGHI